MNILTPAIRAWYEPEQTHVAVLGFDWDEGKALIASFDGLFGFVLIADLRWRNHS